VSLQNHDVVTLGRRDDEAEGAKPAHFNSRAIERYRRQPCTRAREIGDMEPRVTGNHGTTKRQEKAAIKKVLARSRFALPIHDWPAITDGGQVVGRLRDSVPGPVVQSLLCEPSPEKTKADALADVSSSSSSRLRIIANL
jgi:hypothetical protein